MIHFTTRPRALFSLLISGIVVAIGVSQEPQPRPGASTKIDPANYDRLRTGDSSDGRIVVPTNQVLSPAGRQVTFSGRPTDLALSPDGR